MAEPGGAELVGGGAVGEPLGLHDGDGGRADVGPFELAFELGPDDIGEYVGQVGAVFPGGMGVLKAGDGAILGDVVGGGFGVVGEGCSCWGGHES